MTFSKKGCICCTIQRCSVHAYHIAGGLPLKLITVLMQIFLRVVTDVDECDLGYCGIHGCNNTEGGYTCLCLDGYLPDSDDHVCTGKI